MGGGSARDIGNAMLGVATMGVSTQVQTAHDLKKSASSQAAEAAKQAAGLKNAQAVASSQAQAALAQKQRRMLSGSQTIYTSPLGASGLASTVRKVLLGQ